MNFNIFLHISTQLQQLEIIINSKITKSYPISTAKNGVGEIKGSGCTPCGWHYVRAKIGDLQPLNSVFIARRPTGEIYNIELSKNYPNRDWILTRILWLDGLEAGKNRYGNVHTASRYIYIHGCPDELILGQPESHGCIRMKNIDILDLFNRILVGTKVFIE
ncbi:MAG: L,D-transpeptidase [Methylococcales bacterium]|nr:L,D-transpeptidase [Methylococcales bacterium]MDD5754538.1 L,D-transpeptidase [Methylococcales bacterium]